MAQRHREERRSDLGARVLAALPAIVFAIFIVAQGGLVFALGLIVLAVVALGELYSMFKRVRPVNLAGILAVAAMILTALYGAPRQIVLVLVLAFPLTFFLSFLRPRRDHVAWAIAVTLFGVLYIGLPFVHAVLLRELPHGDGLLIDVLVGTFVGDTAAYAGGRLYGRTPLAPVISPNKTLEGLAIGFLGGTLAFWFAGLYQDWLPGTDALIIGACVAAVAPLGDLFESMIKRDLAVKDTSRFFGAHGGVMDRLDAVFFTVVIGYYVSVAFGY